MKFQRINQLIHYSPWFMSAAGYRSMVDVFETYSKAIEGGAKSFLDLSDFVNPRPDMHIDRNGIAHIHITGVLGQRMSKIEKSCGNTGYEELSSEIAKVNASNAIGAIFYNDSCGGSAVGVAKPAAEIAAMKIPTVGVCDSVCASANYYLAAGMDYLISTADAINGSIGTILPWVDKSKLWELNGITADPIVNEGADLKDSLYDPSMTEEQRAFLQSHVNDLASQFRDHVSNHRELDSEVWRAGFYVGSRAIELNLVDEIGGVDRAFEYLMG